MMFLKFKKAIIVDYIDLETEIREKYGLTHDELSIMDLYGEMCENGGFRNVGISDDSMRWLNSNLAWAIEHEASGFYNVEELRKKVLVQEYLHDIFPDESNVLIEFNW